MNELANLLSAFTVDSIYKGTHGIAAVVAMYLSPALLITAIYIRLMETQLDSLAGQGRFGVALRDILGWGFVLGSYFAIGNLITEYINSIYAWADSIGSVKKIIETFPKIMEKAGQAEPKGMGAVMATINSMTPFALAVDGLYYLTIIVMAALSAFLRIAVALCFGIAFIWGLIAIPMSISTSFRILRGWGWLLGFALVWPVVEAILVGLVGSVFAEAASNMQAAPGATFFGQSPVKAVLCVCNLIVCATLIAAPFITNALVTNASAATGVVMPFVGAALAATKGASSLAGRAFPTSTQGAPRAPSPPPIPTPRNTPKAPPPTPSGPQKMASGQPSAPNTSNMANTPPPPPTEATRRARQQRRGVIINSKKPGST